MNCRRVFLVPKILVFATQALAQSPRHPGMQAGGGADHPAPTHPGQGQHQMVTPEMHHQHMMEQFWYEQWLLNEMFRVPRPGRALPESPRRAG
jgi:hypothetical protein